MQYITLSSKSYYKFQSPVGRGVHRNMLDEKGTYQHIVIGFNPLLVGACIEIWDQQDHLGGLTR